MLSFFDLLIFDTTIIACLPCGMSLWFAFILWSTDIWYNRTGKQSTKGVVVICFHSLIYWYLIQPSLISVAAAMRCDLLSFFDLLIFDTTCPCLIRCLHQLWFAFILWSTDIWYNDSMQKKLDSIVVICFHSLIYWYLIQRRKIRYWILPCCDLLSFFDLLIFDTTASVNVQREYLLWFAFILWSTDIWYNLEMNAPKAYSVVICFHSLIYWYLIQLMLPIVNGGICCDLLSFFDLLIFDTTSNAWCRRS